MTSGKLLCKSHLGSFFLACKYIFLFSVFPKYFPPKEWALWGQEWSWMLLMQCQRGLLSVRVIVQESPPVQGSAVASLLTCVQILLVTYSSKGWRSCSDPTNAWATSWEAGIDRDRDMRNLTGLCHLQDVGHRTEGHGLVPSDALFVPTEQLRGAQMWVYHQWEQLPSTEHCW